MLALFACSSTSPALALRASRIPASAVATAADPFEPLPREVNGDPRLVEIGRRLFEDNRVSGDGTRACVDCHELATGGVVPAEARSNHPMNETGPYNVPTVFNVGFNFRHNWQGTFETLEDHVGGPMMNALVMNAGSWPALVTRLEPTYTQPFLDAGYSDGVSERGVRDAFAAYERALVTPDSTFDRFLRGEVDLSESESAGYELFKEVGCSSCHQGINVGGNLFQRFGVMEDAFEGRNPREADYGRMLQTGRDEDAHVFRVPSLRNVAVTAPYFHDGSATTLDRAVVRMGRVQLGYALDEREVADLVAFLHTLTGEFQGVLLGAAGS